MMYNMIISSAGEFPSIFPNWKPHLPKKTNPHLFHFARILQFQGSDFSIQRDLKMAGFPQHHPEVKRVEGDTLRD